jgi:secreted PhoX family phosphatase
MSAGLSRRGLLAFLGASAACLSRSRYEAAHVAGVSDSGEDGLRLAPGLFSHVLVGAFDVIGPGGLRFGYDNDFLACAGSSDATGESWLWANHEQVVPALVSSREGPPTEADVAREEQLVGGSFVPLVRGADFFEVDPTRRGAFRLDATTRLPFVGPGADRAPARGTLANCGGGVTPWGSILSGEENWEDFFGHGEQPSRYGWECHRAFDPLDYGWVVEVDVARGVAHKLSALGRFAHESAACTRASDGRAVVYLSDDGAGRCLYKFVSTSSSSLEHGQLFVADVRGGQWLPLSRAESPALSRRFTTNFELLCHAREAAVIAGGSPLDRPEGLALDPQSGALVVALTNHVAEGRPHGRLMRLDEVGGDAKALRFSTSTVATGGPSEGFSCPDNLTFTPRGDVLFTTDIDEREVGTGAWSSFRSNALFHLSLASGHLTRLACGPRDCELTGPCLTPDGLGLFLSVQHPGRRSLPYGPFTSNWPDGAGRPPRPGVVELRGPALRELLHGPR